MRRPLKWLSLVVRYFIGYQLFCRRFNHRFRSMRYIEDVHDTDWIERECAVCLTTRYEPLSYA